MMGLALSLTAQQGRARPLLSLPGGSDFVTINVSGGTVTITIAGHPVSAYNGEYTIDAADVTGDDSTIYGGPGFYVLRDGLGDPIGPVVYGETTDPADISRAHMVVLVDPAVYAAAGRVPVLTGVWELDGVAMSGGDIDTRINADAGVYTVLSRLTKPDGTILEIESAGHTVGPAVPWSGYPTILHAYDAQVSGSVILAPDVQTWEDQVGSLDLAAPATGQQPFYTATDIGSTYPALTTTTAADMRTLKASITTFDSQNFVAILIAKTSPGDAVLAFGKTGDSGPIIIVDQKNEQWRVACRLVVGGTVFESSGTPDPDNYAVVTAYAVAGSTAIRVNGVAVGSAVSVGAIDIDGISLFSYYVNSIGATQVAGVATLLLAPDNTGPDALDLTDIAAIENAVAARYGLSGLMP